MQGGRRQRSTHWLLFRCHHAEYTRAPACFLLLLLLLVLKAKTRDLKQNLNNEFRSIHELCMFVLANTRKVELLRATLTALAAYLSWIPPGTDGVLSDVDGCSCDLFVGNLLGRLLQQQCKELQLHQ